MGSSETEKTLNEEKEGKEPKTPAAQEPSLATTANTVNPEWFGYQNVMQAYSPMHPHGFLASGPQPHPYMWGVQHLMPPYGTPPHPYVAMYPSGGMYAHPHMPPGSYPFSPFAIPSSNGIPEASMSTPGNMEVDGKPSEAKEKLPIKRSKGSLGSLKKIALKNGEPSKSSGGSANGANSKSAESGSEGSSDGSDANSQNELQVNSGTRQDPAEANQNGSAANMSQNGGLDAPHSMVNHTMTGMPIPIAGVPGGPPGPTTTLNIGMDYWGNATPSAIPAMRGQVSPAPVAGGMVTAGSRDNFQSQIWDERELKRQRRKQSNRESARRSRLRKQAECDELAQRAELLKEENASLKAELNLLRSERHQLLTQNASLKERLGDVAGEETLKSDHLGDDDTRYSEQEEPAQSDQ